jgi:hypothetical protein
MAVVELMSLTKRFGKVAAVDDLARTHSQSSLCRSCFPMRR